MVDSTHTACKYLPVIEYIVFDWFTEKDLTLVSVRHGDEYDGLIPCPPTPPTGFLFNTLTLPRGLGLILTGPWPKSEVN